MKASGKKTVRGTVFSERAEESFSMAVNRASEMEEKTDGTPLSSANPKKLENGLSKLFSGFLFCSDNSVFFIVFFIRYFL